MCSLFCFPLLLVRDSSALGCRHSAGMKCLQLLTALLWVSWLAQTTAAAAAAVAAGEPGTALLGDSSSSTSSRRKLRQLEWYCAGGGAAEVDMATRVKRRSRPTSSSTRAAAAAFTLPVVYDFKTIRLFKRKVPLTRQKALYAARVAAGSGRMDTSSVKETPAADVGISISSSSGLDAVIAAGLVTPRSVCALDPPFLHTTASRCECSVGCSCSTQR
jgi:hypothetical protein